jgi:predicted RNase H-like HicB family nuclease
MPHTTTIKDYDIHVYWDNRAEYFVAEIPEILTCAADGTTQAEAVSKLAETFAVLKEAYAEEGLPIPKPNPELPISIRELSALSDVVKISRLAELAGIPGQTLATKLKRGTEFNVGESRKIARTLDERGLTLNTSNLGRNLVPKAFCVEERSTGYLVSKRGRTELAALIPTKKTISIGAKKRLKSTKPT